MWKQEIAEAADPAAKRAHLVRDYREEFANPYVAAGKGYVDDVIEPGETRAKLLPALEANLDKDEVRPVRKHGNIPL